MQIIKTRFFSYPSGLVLEDFKDFIATFQNIQNTFTLIYLKDFLYKVHGITMFEQLKQSKVMAQPKYPYEVYIFFLFTHKVFQP